MPSALAPAGCARIAALLTLLFALGPSPLADDAGKRFSAGAPGTDAFGPNPNLACPRSGVASLLADDLKKMAEKNKRPEAKEDGRLCAAAQALLAWDPANGEGPPAPVLVFVSANVGLPVPVKRALVKNLELKIVSQEGHTAQTDENIAVAQALIQPVAEILLGYDEPRWGMATQRVRKGLVKVAVVMDDRVLELDPLPRKLAAGQSAPLSGRILPPYTNPRLAVSDERGQIVKAEAVPGDAFKGELRCGSGPGDLWVEIQADRSGRTAPAAAFSVACGKDLPAWVALSAPAWPSDLPGQERRLADNINAQREAIGIGPVEWDEKLAGVAREAAEAVRDQLARGEKPEVELAQMLGKAGVASGLVLQNPAQAKNAEDAEQRFTASPTNRQNILNPEVNRVGVGIAPVGGGQGSTVIVVELFTKALAKVDPEAVKRDIYAAIEKRRAEAGATHAEVDPKLEKTAQEYAESLAESAGKLSQDEAGEITQGIRIAYKSIDLLDGAKANPLDFAADQTVLSPGTSMGLGIAQGDHPVLGKNAVYVTFIVATPRTPEAAKPAAAQKPSPKKTTK
ncbi:MAG TPA: CAP domain-containing protein [Anaeromyxobacter sp.]|nr:CAP domain-containing protein [Anaeromyxobacter sp.]